MTSARLTAWSVALCVMAAAGLSACREHGRPDPNIRMAVSHEPDVGTQAAPGGPGTETEAPGGVAGKAPSVPTRLEVPDAVREAYSGVVLLWKDASNGKEGRIEVPLGGSVKVPGSELEVSADVFLPHFTMTADVITSSGIEEGNPAARIRVSEGGKEIFRGFIFKGFPDVHPFTHPRFALRLDGGVRKPAK
jgi:hypothetical protein